MQQVHVNLRNRPWKLHSPVHLGPSCRAAMEVQPSRLLSCIQRLLPDRGRLRLQLVRIGTACSAAAAAAAAVPCEAGDVSEPRARGRPVQPRRPATKGTWSPRGHVAPQVPGGTAASGALIKSSDLGMQMPSTLDASSTSAQAPTAGKLVHRPVPVTKNRKKQHTPPPPANQAAAFDRSKISRATLALPGVAAGAAPASDQALLQALKAVPKEDLHQILADLQVLLTHDTVAGQQRHFLADTETSAFGDSGDVLCRVLEVFCLDLETGDKFHTLINHGGPVDRGAAKMHGLTADKLKGHPSTQVASAAFMLWLWQRCASGSGGTSQLVLATHNAPFDLRVLAASFADAGLFYPAPAAPSSGWMAFCSLKCAKALFPENTSATLGSVAADMGLPGNVHHRAEADVQMLHAVLQAWTARFCCDHTLQEAITCGFGLPSAAPSVQPVRTALTNIKKKLATGQ